MAKKISSSDLFEQEDLFKGVRDSAAKTLETFNKLQAELKATAQGLKTELTTNTQASTAQLKQFSAASEKANNLMKQSLEIDRLKAEASKAKTQADSELIKLQKLKNQEAEKEARTAAKVAKETANQNNAYKVLEKNTRELKNQSKELGAQMLILEQSGKKNSAEYDKLAKKYKTVTQAAQKGDAQLKKLDKTVGDNFRNVGNYQSALGGLNKVLGALGVGVGISQLKSFITESINLSRIQEKAVAQVAAGLASTGGVVGYTLDELKAKASALQKESLFGDERILTDLTSVMLTFTNITGEAFDRAQQAALDLSTRMKGDLTGAAVQLGKALNDPVKGVTALSKVGVSFTEQQKEQIKTLVESGKLYDAQTIILNELNKEFGGSAKAAAEADGGITQLADAFGDAREELGKMILDGLKPTIQALKEFFYNLTTDDIRNFVSTLGTIGKIVLKVTAAWATYRAGIIAVNAANFIMNGGIQQTIKSMAAAIPGTRAYKLEQIQLARAQQGVGTTAQGAGTAVKGFGQAFKAIAWMALIATLAELAVAWYDIASGTAEARRQQDMFNRAKENADKKAQELQGKTQSGIDETIRKLDLELRTRKAKGESEAKLEAERAQRTKKIISDAKSEYDAKTKGALQESNELWHLQKRLKAADEAYKKSTSNIFASGKEQKKARDEWNATLQLVTKKVGKVGIEDAVNKLNAKYTETVLTYNNLAKGQKSFNDQLEEAAVKTIEATTTTEDYGVKIADNTHKIKANTKALEENVDLTREIQDEQVKAIQDEGQRAQTELIIQAQRRIEDIEKTVADKNQKATLIKQIEANLITALDKMDSEWYAKSLEAQKQADANKLKAKNEFLDKIEEITEANTRRTMSDQEVEEREVTDKYFELEQLAKGDAEALAQIEIAKMNELNDIRLKYQNIEYDNKKEADEKIKDADKKKNEEMWQTTQEFAQKTTDYFKKQSDERIAQIEKEISAAEKQADYYRELAANGNINAQQSLAEQERIIAESNRRKEREQKRQQRMELANTIYQTYSGHAAKDPDTALMKTIKDASLLQAFISSLPMFYDGTEDTGKGGGVDGKGGFHAVLHPHERVIPKSLNDQIGSLSNEQLTRLAMEYNNGRLVGQDVAHSSMDLAVLVSKLDNLTEVIKQKPETNIELGQITQSAMEIVQSTRKGNTTVYNRFKVQK